MACFIYIIKLYKEIRSKELKYSITIADLERKNTYLEHAAKILRHDMHSGINVYLPRGINSLERRLPAHVIAEYRLEAPLKLTKEGLVYTQKVYAGVKEFTNLVKQGVSLQKTRCEIKSSLEKFLDGTAYKDQVILCDLPTIEVNEPLFCTAVDNLIRNGLRYNDSETKMVYVFTDNEDMMIEDNGRGMTQEEFLIYSKPYARKNNQKEAGTGLGLGIAIAILNEHGFSISCRKLETGTQLRIKLK